MWFNNDIVADRAKIQAINYFNLSLRERVIIFMGKLFDRFDAEAIKGRDITMEKYSPGIFVSSHDEVFCYTGVRLVDDDTKESQCFYFPNYMRGKQSTDPSISDEITGFYRVMDGCIVIDNFVNKGIYERCLFKKTEGIVRYPSSNRYYSVIVNGEEDDSLTRAVFGFTYDELTSLLEAYAKVMGTHHEWFSYPRITKSGKYEHYCDLSNMWIPESFPHIAFNEGGYYFSHVSLWGFYCHLQILTDFRENSVFSRALLKYGLEPEILNRLFELGKHLFHQTKVIKGMK